MARYLVEYDDEGWHTAWSGTDVQEAEKRYVCVMMNYGCARLIQVIIADDANYDGEPTYDGEKYARFANEE